MGRMNGWLKTGLEFVGLVLLAVAGVLLFAAVAVALRPLLIVGFVVAGIGGLVLSCFSPGVREWFEAAGESQIRHRGLRLATDIAAHPGHSWARILPEGVAIGADDLVQTVLGPVEAVELPPVGSRIQQGDRLFAIRRGDRSVEVRSPVTGTVLARNEALLDHPGLLNEQPFNGGWAVRVRADNVRQDRQRLLQGKQARDWFRQEIDRLIGALLGNESAQPTLQDGGAIVDDLYRHIDNDAWKTVKAAFFDRSDAPAAI